MYSVFPVQRSESEWLEDSGIVFLSWAVFNPNGPTFYCVGLRDTRAHGEQEIFFRWMHFLGGEDYCLGYVNQAEPDWTAQVHEALSFAFTSDVGAGFRRFPVVNAIPSFVRSMMSEDWNDLLRSLFAGTKVFQSADWGRESYLLTKFGSDLFSRAGEEIRGVYEEMRQNEADEHIQDGLESLRLRHGRQHGWQQWSPNAFQSRGIQDGDVDSWWRVVSAGDYIVRASLAFAQAWVGAPHEATLEVKTTFDEVAEFLRRYGHPIWPPDINADWLEQSMGFRR